MPLPNERTYTIEDIFALPEGERAELIDGQLYMMSPPNYKHQKLVSKFTRIIGNYIDSNGGPCEVLPAPLAVRLNADDKTYVEPDISVICDPNKITEKGVDGAPDFIIEIVSPGTQRRDYGIKLFKYRTAGVREYWMIDPDKRKVIVYDFEHEDYPAIYGLEEKIPVRMYEGRLQIDANMIREMIREYPDSSED